MRSRMVVPILVLFMLLPSSILAAAAPGQVPAGTMDLTSFVLEGCVEFQFGFEPSGVEFYDVDGSVVVSKEGMGSTAVTGEPLVPVSLHSFVIDPYASEVEIEIVSSTFDIIPAPGPIMGVPRQVPIGLPEDIPPTEYSVPLDGPLRTLATGYVRGHFIQDIAFQPVLPLSDGTLMIYSSVEGRIRFSFPVNGERTSTTSRSTSVFRSYLEGKLENPEDLDRFGARPIISPASSRLQEEDVQYVLVTNSTLVGDHLTKIRDWKQQKGVPSRIVEMSFITSNYNGTDAQEKVRNFIKDAVYSWETEYILLGGDISVIPYRSTYVKSGSYVETDCAADLYYSDLDGSFNDDNDSLWGEVEDNVDLRPDVIVGRAPAQTSEEMDTFVKKTLKYEIDPISGYLDNVTLAGEYLDANTNSSLGLDLIKNNLLPPNINATSLYDSAQGVFGNLDRPNFMAQVDRGLSYAFHSGHSNYNVMSVGTAGQSSLYSTDVPSYSGGYRIGVMNSLGCIANRFSVNDCIGELHVMESDGGSVVFIGNSRYGWYAPYNPGMGTSDVYMYRMAIELFSNGNTNMGAHFALAKDAFTGYSGSDGSYRWLQMALNMMGEPEMHVRTAEPGLFNITLPDNIGRSYTGFNITVNNASGSPVKNALVCLQQSGYYAYNLTGSDGKAFFDISTQNFDIVNVTVTGYNFLPFTANISIDIRPPSLIINSCGNATTGDDYEFNCTAIDEAGILSVLLDLRMEGQDSNDTVTYQMVNDGSYWTVPVGIPQDSTKDLLCRYRGRDNSGNWNETLWTTVNVIDNDMPWIIDDMTDPVSTTGEVIDFNITAGDNIDVSSIQLSISWNGSEGTEHIDMVHAPDRWVLAWDVPSDRIGTLDYIAAVHDGAGNINASHIGSVLVLDNDAPVILQDLSDTVGSTSDDVRFIVSVEDNIGLEGVFVEFWRLGYPEHETIPMVSDEELWTLFIELSPSDLGTIYHIFHAMDTSGNWVHSLEGNSTVMDDDPPLLLMDRSPLNATTGDPLEFRVSVSDNIQVGSVVVYSSIAPDPLDMEPDPDGVNWTVVVNAPSDSILPVTYSFQAWDTSDNTNMSGDRTLSILDNDGPTFGNLTSAGVIDAGGNLSVTIGISDNIGVERAQMEWWIGGSAKKDLIEMVDDTSGYSGSFGVPLEAFGTVYFRVRAWDLAGNSMVSQRYEASIIEYDPEGPGDDDEPIPGDDDYVEPVDDDISDDDDNIPAEGVDEDLDGMDDLWEYINGLDTSRDDSLSDLDGDGYRNIDEYRAGSDPGDISSFPRPSDDDGIYGGSNLLLLILIGTAALCLIILIVVAVVIAVRRSREATDVWDLDEDEVMSWD
ncbi:MAG: hypothetical protein JXA22_09690 [Candidatus Thermoplasmatota archaeon]|nr:hypothetical protein [Candidatus Thermoplasmatota archaeon]